MAIEQGSETLTVATEERTWKVEIFTDKGMDPLVRAYRQTIKSAPNGTIISSDNNAVVERRFSAVMNDTFTAGGVTVTGAQLAGLISQAADQWRQEDLVPPNPNQAMEGLKDNG